MDRAAPPLRRTLFTAALLPVSALAAEIHVGVSVSGELDARGPRAMEERIEAEDAPGLLLGITHPLGFGAELAYLDLGELRALGIADGGFRTDGRLWSLSSTWAWRLDRIEPYARLGWFVREEGGESLSIAGPAPLSLDDDGLVAELGLRWRVSEPVSLRLGYVHYDFERSDDGSLQLAAEWRIGR